MSSSILKLLGSSELRNFLVADSNVSLGSHCDVLTAIHQLLDASIILPHQHIIF